MKHVLNNVLKQELWTTVTVSFVKENLALNLNYWSLIIKFCIVGISCHENVKAIRSMKYQLRPSYNNYNILIIYFKNYLNKKNEIYYYTFIIFNIRHIITYLVKWFNRQIQFMESVKKYIHIYNLINWYNSPSNCDY